MSVSCIVEMHTCVCKLQRCVPLSVSCIVKVHTCVCELCCGINLCELCHRGVHVSEFLCGEGYTHVCE